MLSLLALALVPLALVGCAGSGRTATPHPPPVATTSPINELNLVAMPMAINVNRQPGGANGIAVKVFAADRERPKAQRITQGTLELIMLDGLVTTASAGTNRLLHTWSFPASELPAHAFVTAVGTGYLFSLGWGKDRPRSNGITVFARYLPPQGAAISSAPSFISLVPSPQPKQ